MRRLLNTYEVRETGHHASPVGNHREGGKYARDRCLDVLNSVLCRSQALSSLSRLPWRPLEEDARNAHR
jgi:hypothetical protein